MIATDDLVSMTGAELDALYGASPSGRPPTGLGRGTALVLPGTRPGRAIAAVVRRTAWQGKEFSPEGTRVRNLLTPVGVRAITAAVSLGASRFDGHPCVVLDYAATSRVARWVHDEIREVAPGLYLGIVYVRSRRAPVHFVLDFGRADDDDVAAPHSAGGLLERPVGVG